MAHATLKQTLATFFGWFRARPAAPRPPADTVRLFPVRPVAPSLPPEPLLDDARVIPEPAPSFAQQAVAAERSGDPAAALGFWHAACAADSTDADAHLHLGTVLLRAMNQPAEAMQILARAAERFPDHIGLWRGYAECANLTADFEIVVRASHRLAELEPDKPFWPAAEAAALRDLGRLDDADALLVAAIARFPPDQALLTTYAWVANYRGDWAEALRRWQGFLFHFKSDKIGAWLVGRILAALPDQPEATDRLLATATWRFPENLDVAMDYARLPSTLGNWPESLRRWDELARDHPDQAEIASHRAEAELRTRNDAQAARVLSARRED